jgi:peptidyl-prolyl cis-trans isomerase C
LNTRTCFRFITLFFILASTACGTSQEVSEPTLAPTTEISAPPTATAIPAAAIVNGEVISLTEFNAEVFRIQQAQEALGNIIFVDEAEERVLNDLIDQILLVQAARADGFTLTDAEVEARIETLAADVGGEENLSTWLANHNYTSESFFLSLKKAISAAWMRDKILADVDESAEQVHAQQILLYNLERAEDVQANLAAGADFGELASAYDPNTNGELFWFPRGYLLEKTIEDVAFLLAINTPSEIIETEIGFHIIVVLEKAEDHLLSPDALLALQEKALNEWLQKERETSKIE